LEPENTIKHAVEIIGVAGELWNNVARPLLDGYYDIMYNSMERKIN
jgi:hypothetical protein